MVSPRLPADVQRTLEAIVRQVQAAPALRAGEQAVRALFVGPSGSEKQAAAQWLAQRLGIKLRRVDLARVVSKYVGETEKNLQELFEAAHASGALLYFDEADALFGKRSDVREAEDRYANVDLNFLLQRIEVYQGVLVFAAYRRDDIDPALLRRLPCVIDFSIADE
jgi:SpoVK/Ycf46/Vps4 family AAA+-type ATPase